MLQLLLNAHNEAPDPTDDVAGNGFHKHKRALTNVEVTAQVRSNNIELYPFSNK